MKNSFKSFGFVEEKLEEARFFLEQMQGVGVNIIAMRWYFSAFVSAARSVTFVLQFTLSDTEEFAEWYEQRKIEMQHNEIMRFFVDRRNDTQKKGSTMINFGRRLKNKGKPMQQYLFVDLDGNQLSEDDVETACKNYFKIIESLILHCKKDFEKFANPDWLFSLDNLKSEKLSIEDLEEKLGFPRGWTAIIPPEERVKALRDATPPMIPYVVFDQIKRL